MPVSSLLYPTNAPNGPNGLFALFGRSIGDKADSVGAGMAGNGGRLGPTVQHTQQSQESAYFSKHLLHFIEISVIWSESVNMVGPDRKRRRPAVNCVKSKADSCVYDSEDGGNVQRPSNAASNGVVPSTPQVQSVHSSAKGSLCTNNSGREFDAMKSRIRQLEQQLSRATRLPATPRPSPRIDIETTTSQIAGTFQFNRESRLDGNSQGVIRNLVMHKSRIFGASHWAQGAAMFRDIFELVEPHIRAQGSKAGVGIKRCKELARIIKAQRSPQWPCPPTTDLPPKGVADELVDRYLCTVETTYRVLHVPTFKTEYDALWVSQTQPSIAFIVQLKLVLAIGAVTYDSRFSMRAAATRWVYEAHTWLSDPDFKPLLNIQALQSRILLLLAREIINVGGDSGWISAGALLRTALYMGLHRDPSFLPNRTALAAEMRRRLWNTILELSVQSSIVAGGSPLISTDDFDTAPPGNFDDEQLLSDDPIPKPDDEYTQTSIARALRSTFSHRLEITKFLNDLSSNGTYEETIRLDKNLRLAYKTICRTLKGFTYAPSSSQFEIRILDAIIHHFLCCLHMPFFERSLKEAQYAFSRKVIIECAQKIWCTVYPSSLTTAGGHAPGISSETEDDVARFVTNGFGFFRLATMLSIMFVSSELRAQLQDDDSLGPSPYRHDLFALISDAKFQSWKIIESGETNVKGYLLASMVSAQIDALRSGMEPEKLSRHVLLAAEEAEDRCLTLMEERAGYNGVNLDMDLSENTTPYMGDWEFIYSQTLQNITDAKLAELSNKRQIFLARKAAAIEEAGSQPTPLEQVRALSNGVRTCFGIRVDEAGRIDDKIHSDRHLVIELSNLDRFLKQAECDPSISGNTLERWRRSLLDMLDVQTLKYEYATLFAQLTMEWLSVKKKPAGAKVEGFEELASAQKLESRKQWEDHVFTPADVDPDVVKEFLGEIFNAPSDATAGAEHDNAKAVAKAIEKLREKVSKFEVQLSSTRLDTNTLLWVIKGLLHSDLPTEKQRAVLKEFQQDSTVLNELVDVLNMRLAALETWSWGPEVFVEQRRQLNGSYQIKMQEDLIQAIFLQYLGVKWSVFFKGTFTDFRRMKNVWKTPRSSVPAMDMKRRNFFLGPRNDKPSLQIVREGIYRSAYFVSQLMDSQYTIRNQQEGEQEATRGHGRAKQTARRIPSATQQMPAQMPAQMAQRQMMQVQAAPRARMASGATMEEEQESDESDEDMGFGLFDGESEDFDPDQTYDSMLGRSVKRPANQMQAKQNLLLLLSAEITISKRLYGEITCFRTQYESLFPSLPHSTILSVLSFFGVSPKWASFFERFLSAPLKFTDESGTEPRLRRRGSPGAHVLSEVFGEITLFCLDFKINKETNGEVLWRVNDDMWFWSKRQETSIAAWEAIQKFNAVMGLPLSQDSSGGAHIAEGRSMELDSSLPAGKIRWGMLYLNPESGRFEIDQEMVSTHIRELKSQLHEKESSVFGWIQAWNSYAITFFTYNFGTPANCFGQNHVDMMLQTHERIQREVFSSDGKGDDSVLTFLRETIRQRFGTTAIPDGYFFLPIDLGGLELSSPFIKLLGLRDSVTPDPNTLLDKFFKCEQETYDTLKRRYLASDKDRVVSKNAGFRPHDVDSFLSFEEYTLHRENLDYGFHYHLGRVYDDLLRRPTQQVLEYDATGPLSIGQLYGPEIIDKFGGFNVVDPGLLPIGLVSQFRSGRVSWE
ncbi:hypothetical protein BDV18DRAFT_166387 [Aspergillus unguis]